ncbi:neuronal membrane glycoprotein M6-a-like [Pecten maximus]|uniref:neuronal membrane glycoprotein M6-a-like n=1 Tax=Pecten maximus TaxID=6579 RepID=UPI0014585953|nr:neuronal membrane glycoprotein M6-a-like [Pecten maximus]
MGCERIGNVPFASLIATMITFTGVGVFCGTLYRALTLIITNILEELFQFNVPWLEVIKIVFVIVAVIMGVFAIILLAFGYLSTGATRKNVYSGAKCIMGGRVSAAFFLIMTYLMNLAWLGIVGACVVPVVGYIMINSYCYEKVYNKAVGTVTVECFSLTRFGIYRNSTAAIGIGVPGREQLCAHTDLRLMCDKVAEAGPLFCVACAGAVLIVLGMIHFMIAIGANYTRIKISKELTEYRDAVDMEELDLHNSRGYLDKDSSSR